jgi:hypothetical protein
VARRALKVVGKRLVANPCAEASHRARAVRGIQGGGVRSSFLVSSRGQLRTHRPPLSALVADPKDAPGIARAYLEHRYTQQEIADHLGVHHLTISRRVRTVDGRRFRNTVRN